MTERTTHDERLQTEAAIPLGLSYQGPIEKRAGELIIGYVHMEGLCWTFFRYHLQLQMSLLGFKLIVRPVGTLNEQLAEIDSLLREPIDVLLLRPFVSGHPSLTGRVRQAQELGIKVISLDGSVGGDCMTTTVGIDNAAGQAGVAEYVCQRLQGRGRIAHLQGNQNMETGYLRTRGLHAVLEHYPDVELVHEVELDWGSTVPLRQQGVQLARQALALHPSLDAILTTSDECAFGVFETLRELGASDRIMVTGFDALPEALIAIEDGQMEASVHQPMDLMADQVLKEAVRLTSGRPVETVNIRLPAETVSRRNLGEAALRALKLFPDVIDELNQRRVQQQATAVFLAALIDNLPDIVFVKDADSLRYVRCNSAADDWAGVPRGTLLGKTAFDIYPEKTAARCEAIDREVLRTGVPVDRTEEMSLRKSSEIRYMHTRKVPIHDTRGRPAYLLGVLQDVTEREMADIELAQHARELEAAIAALSENRERLVNAEKMAALGSLVAGVAHELNTPIGNALIAATTLMDSTRAIREKYAHGLSRSVLNTYLSDARDGALILERNLHRAADLIRSFKQIAVDQSSSETRRFSLATVVKEVLATLWPSIKKTPFTVYQSIPDDIELDSYPGPLEQVLINLINNAIIHGLDGRENGRVSVTATRQGDDRVCLIVEDNGKGISEEQRQRVFEPFFTTRAEDGGTGLGLSISHSIVTGQLAGDIELTSRLGEGTRFCVTIPLKVRPGAVAAE